MEETNSQVCDNGVISNFPRMDNISSEDRNVLLVILALLLTVSFQASLTPPGGIWQGDGSTNYTDVNYENLPGAAVMKHTYFLQFYIPTCAVFIVTFFLTLGLLKSFPRGFRTALQILLAFLAICFDRAISFIAPTDLEVVIIHLFSIIACALMMLMCISYRVSKISVLILGCWYFPISYMPVLIGNLGLGCLLFLFLYDEYWKGTALVSGHILLGGPFVRSLPANTILVGCWLVLGLFRFIIKRYKWLTAHLINCTENCFH